MRTPPYRSPAVTGLLPPSGAPTGGHGPPIATRGPLGLAFVPVVVAAPGPVVAASKNAARQNTLPAPEQQWTSANKIPKRFKDRPLFAKQGAPSIGDIRQQGIGNCYLAGLLGAMANTPNGRARITRLIAKHSGAIETRGHDYVDGEAGPLRTIAADRYFEVTFPGAKPVTTSDVLYADDSDRDRSPIFMDSPDGVLWPSIVELAYATLHGGAVALYEPLGAKTLPKVGLDVLTADLEALFSITV